MQKILTIAFFSTTLLAAPPILAAETVDDHVAVSLVSEQASVAPGATVSLGIQLRHEPDWHTYWINPGDSGLPTRVNWTLPAGFAIGEIAWPTPKRFAVDGLQNFGYDGQVLLPVSLHVPADAKPGSVAHIVADVKWLVCHEECVPGKSTLSVDLPIAASSASGPLDSKFEAARNTQPKNGEWKAQARIVADQIQVQVRGADLASGNGLDAFAEQLKIVANTPPQMTLRNGIPLLNFAKSDYFTSMPKTLDLIVTRPGAQAIRVHALFVSGNPASANPVPVSP